MAADSAWMIIAGEVERIHPAALEVYVHRTEPAFLVRLWRLEHDSGRWMVGLWYWQLRVGGIGQAELGDSERQGPPPFERVNQILSEAIH